MFAAEQQEQKYERPDLCRRDRGVLRFERALRPLVRAAIRRWNMETLLIGLIALALFGYLFVAMVWPEKF